MTTASTIPAQALPEPAKGGTVTWACRVGFPPTAIFPFTPPERFGLRNINEFQMLMFRPLYWLGKAGKPGIDYDLSLAEPPVWEDGKTVTVTLKPWKWSNGETICADNVMFWMNMMAVKGSRFGGSAPGSLPENLTAYEKVAHDKVRFTFDRPYSRTWVLMNQLTLITPMPRAWDRVADDVPANGSASLADIPAVYDYLVAQNGEWTEEGNHTRTRWADSPVWSVVNGPWRLKSYTLDGVATLVPNERYSGPGLPYLEEFRQIPISHDEQMYRLLRDGPDGPGAVQVGYLPAGMMTGAAGQPADGPRPVAEDYRTLPVTAYCCRLMLINFENSSAAGRLLKQAYLRQALQCCLDQDFVIREIFQGYGHRASGPVPSVPDSPYLSASQRDNALSFDTEHARALLAEHGWEVTSTPAVCRQPGAGPGRAGEGIAAGDTASLTIRYASGDVALDRLVRRLASDAATAGIELRLESVPGNTLLSEDHSKPDEQTRWELNTWNGGWAYYGLPTGEVLFKTGGGANYGRYSDPRADELIDKTLISDDMTAMHEYQDYIAEQVPVIFMPSFPVRLLEVARNLRGVEPVNPYGLINPENWYYGPA